MRYCPARSVTALRIFLMRAGLEASTVTPGRMAPDSSLTVPVRVPCAYNRDGSSRVAIRVKTAFDAPRIAVLHQHQWRSETDSAVEPNKRVRGAFNDFCMQKSIRCHREERTPPSRP